MTAEQIAVYVGAFLAYSMLFIAYLYVVKTIWTDLKDMKYDCRSIMSDMQDIATKINELKNEI